MVSYISILKHQFKLRKSSNSFSRSSSITLTLEYYWKIDKWFLFEIQTIKSLNSLKKKRLYFIPWTQSFVHNKRFITEPQFGKITWSFNARFLDWKKTTWTIREKYTFYCRKYSSGSTEEDSPSVHFAFDGSLLSFLTSDSIKFKQKQIIVPIKQTLLNFKFAVFYFVLMKKF